MSKDMKLSGAVERIAWGYVFLHFHLNINTFDLVPDWVCFCLILTALPVLGQVQRSVLLLRPLAIGLCAWLAVTWIIPVSNTVLELTASIVGLYFHFQLLTDLAAIGDSTGYPGTKKLLNLRTWRTVIVTALSLPLDYSSGEALFALSAGVMFVILIWTVVALFSLRDHLRKIQISAD